MGDSPMTHDGPAGAGVRELEKLKALADAWAGRYGLMIGYQEAAQQLRPIIRRLRVALRAPQPQEDIDRLRRERDAAILKHQCSEGVLSMTVARLGGIVEGRPTERVNFLQRIDELVAKEAVSAVGDPPEGRRLPGIEVVAAAVHDAWMQQKRAKGITTAPSQSTGEEQMRPYDELSHEVQEYDRATVRAVYAAIAAAMGEKQYG